MEDIKGKKLFISYLRVSTVRQGVSGLGLEAQRGIINSFIEKEGGVLLCEYIEVESGGKRSLHKRVKIQQAVQHCRDTGGILIVAKLDRLSRDVEFTMSVINSGIDVVFCDFPYSGKLVLTIIAAVAEYERDLISKRTKEALAAKKARGIKLGARKRVIGDNGEEMIVENKDWNKGGPQASVEARRKRLPFTSNYRYKGYIMMLRNEKKTLGEIADHLNEIGLRTTYGKKFTKRTVGRILKMHAVYKQ